MHPVQLTCSLSVLTVSDAIRPAFAAALLMPSPMDVAEFTPALAMSVVALLSPPVLTAFCESEDGQAPCQNSLQVDWVSDMARYKDCLAAALQGPDAANGGVPARIDYMQAQLDIQ